MEIDKAYPAQVRARDFTAEARWQIESILEKAALLRARDYSILRMHLEKGVTFRDIAYVVGLDEKTVARRIRRLVWRLRMWRCVRLADAGLDASDMAMARSYVVRGLSLRHAAAAHGTNKHAVRKALTRVEAATGCRLVTGRRRKARKGETNELCCKR